MATKKHSLERARRILVKRGEVIKHKETARKAQERAKVAAVELKSLRSAKS